MLRSLQITPSKCTGCLQCEMACSFESEGVFNPAKSRIKVLLSMRKAVLRPTPVLSVPRHGACTLALSTPSSSMRKRFQGRSRRRLRGLQGLHDRLPIRHGELQQDTGKVVKCDLCGGDPACAKACPTEAITYVDADATGLDRMRQWAAQSLSSTSN